jgi:polyferredoxin
VAVLGLALLLMAGAFVTRASTELSVIPERNPLFVTMADGSIRNGYDVKILNKAHAERAYTLTLGDDTPPALLSRPGGEAGDRLTLLAPADDVVSHRVFVAMPPDVLTASSTPLTMVLTDTTSGEERQIATVFRGPEP